MAARFLIVNNGMTEARGHFVETGLAVARAARRRSFDVLMAVHARCDAGALPAGLPTLPLFRVDHWGHIVEEAQPAAVPLRGELRPLYDVPIEGVLEGRTNLRELLDARFAPAPPAAGVKARLVRLAARGVPPAFAGAARRAARRAKGSARMLRALIPPVLFDWLRSASRRARGLPPAPWSEADGSAHLDYGPLPADPEGLLRRALAHVPPDHNEFTHYRMFAADLERLLALCAAGPGDHVYLPTAHGRDAAAIFALVHRVGAERLPTFHLEFRHGMLSPAELDRPVCPFAAFHTRTHRAYFDFCRAHPESEKVRFYADTRELAADFAALAGFPFGLLPIPFRADLIPASAPRDPASPLRILFLGDMREEKGFLKLPPLVRALGSTRLRFVVPGALHPEEREPAMLAALAELDTHPAERVERPCRDGFAPADDYYRLLASADVVLCPYDAKAYRARSSGVFAEAVAAGKPTVVPAGTWMASEQPHGAGEVFADDRELVRAVRRVCDEYERYRAAAEEARGRWLACHNPDSLVEQLIGAADCGLSARRGEAGVRTGRIACATKA